MCGDVYIAGQVQLAQIGRDLIKWRGMLADSEKTGNRTGQNWSTGATHETGLSVKTMLTELNAKLDEWFRSWVWSGTSYGECLHPVALIPAGSPYAVFLGSSARITRLHAEHMRLCINTYALKAGAQGDEVMAQFLKKGLDSAMNTIQTHNDSAQTDLALSFATDVGGFHPSQLHVADADPLVRRSISPSPWLKPPSS